MCQNQVTYPTLTSWVKSTSPFESNLQSKGDDFCWVVKERQLWQYPLSRVSKKSSDEGFLFTDSGISPTKCIEKQYQNHRYFLLIFVYHHLFLLLSLILEWEPSRKVSWKRLLPTFPENESLLSLTLIWQNSDKDESRTRNIGQNKNRSNVIKKYFDFWSLSQFSYPSTKRCKRNKW